MYDSMNTSSAKAGKRESNKKVPAGGGNHPWSDPLTEDTKRQIIFEKLLARAQKPDPEGCFYLHEELEKFDSSVEVVLLKWRKDRAARVNETGSLPLHIACKNIRQLEPVLFIQLLEAYPESISTENKAGNIPIHLAAMHAGLDGNLNRKAISSIEMLIDVSHDGLKTGNIEGLLPAHLAISSQRTPCLELIQILLESYPDAAGIQDIYGHILLHKAVSKLKPDAELVEFLIEIYPEGPTIKDNRGFLPLHWAVTRDRPSLPVLSILLAAYPEGVDVNDNEGFKPLDRLTVRANFCRDSASMLLNTAAKNYRLKQQEKEEQKLHQQYDLSLAAGSVSSLDSSSFVLF